MQFGIFNHDDLGTRLLDSDMSFSPNSLLLGFLMQPGRLGVGWRGRLKL